MKPDTALVAQSGAWQEDWRGPHSEPTDAARANGSDVLGICDGRLFAAASVTRNGVFRFDDPSWVRLGDVPSNMNPNLIANICATQYGTGKLYFGDTGAYVWRLDVDSSGNLVAVTAVGPTGGGLPMEDSWAGPVFNGSLLFSGYSGPGVPCKVYRFDGATWSVVWTASAVVSQVDGFCVSGGSLWFTAVYRTDWHVEFYEVTPDWTVTLRRTGATDASLQNVQRAALVEFQGVPTLLTVPYPPNTQMAIWKWNEALDQFDVFFDLMAADDPSGPDALIADGDTLYVHPAYRGWRKLTPSGEYLHIDGTMPASTFAFGVKYDGYLHYSTFQPQPQPNGTRRARIQFATSQQVHVAAAGQWRRVDELPPPPPFPFAAVTVADDFARADEDPLSDGGKWVQANLDGCTEPLQLIDGAIGNVDPVGHGDSSMTRSDVWAVDMDVWVIVREAFNHAVNDTFALWGRIATPGPANGSNENGYVIYFPFGNDGTIMELWTGGPNWNRLQFATVPGGPLAAGDGMGLRCYGTTIGVYYYRGNTATWTLLFSVENTEYQGPGTAGIEMECRVGAGALEQFTVAVP